MEQILENSESIFGEESFNSIVSVLFPSDTLYEIASEERVILVGIGGAGLKTLKSIKKLLKEKMTPGWQQYIGFLGIDSDPEMLKEMKGILREQEIINITRPFVETRMGQQDNFPPAVKHCMSLPLNNPDINWERDGAGQCRLIGRVKLHDKEPENHGVDEEVCWKLRAIFKSLAPIKDNSEIFVYVIGSLNGGTGSGIVQDMPSLIRHAISPLVDNYVQIIAMLYLSDTMPDTIPEYHVKKARANCYAALKELNYYQNMSAQKDIILNFPYNDLIMPEIIISKYFDDIILLDSNEKNNIMDKNKLAIHVLEEYLLNCFLRKNYQNATEISIGLQNKPFIMQHINHRKDVKYALDTLNAYEASGEAHDFPWIFGSLGVAKATIPHKIVTAYAVDQLCTLSGINRDREANDTLSTKYPFTGSIFSAREGTKHAYRLIVPFVKLLDDVYNGSFDFAKELNDGKDADWDSIHDRNYASYLSAALKKVNSIKYQQYWREYFRKQLCEMQMVYKREVVSFVKQYGPVAFVDVYNGVFISEGDDKGTGIRKMMNNLMVGLNVNGVPYSGFHRLKETIINLNCTQNEILNTSIGRNLFIDRKELERISHQWQKQFNEVIKSAINENQHAFAIGNEKYIDIELCQWADRFAEQVDTYGHVLNEITDMYHNLGRRMENYDTFRMTSDNSYDVNLAALDKSVYDILKNQVDFQIQRISPGVFRDNLIDDFMECPEAWINCRKNAGKENRNIADSYLQNAQKQFADVVTRTMSSSVFPVSAFDIFRNMKQNKADIYSFTESLINTLSSESMVLFDGRKLKNQIDIVLVLPEAFRSWDGAGISLAEIVEKQCKHGEIILYTGDTCNITMFQILRGVPIYRFNKLGAWEKEYLSRIENDKEGLHGLSPSAVKVRIDTDEIMVDRIKWYDYPSITAQDNPKLPDSNGYLSREGQIRNEMEGVLAKAEKWGIIVYKKNSYNKWICERTYLDQSKKWEFNINACTNDDDNSIKTGEELIDCILTQNGCFSEKKRKAYKKNIKLINESSLMNGEWESEKVAREYVPRVLRAHVPMYLEILDTLAFFEENDNWGWPNEEENQYKWGVLIDEWNKEIEKNNIVCKWSKAFSQMFLYGIITCDYYQTWTVTLDHSTVITVLDEKNIRSLRGIRKRQAENFTSYYLYSAVITLLEEKYDIVEKNIEKKYNQLMEQGANDELEKNYELAHILKDEAELLIENGANLKKTYQDLSVQLKEYLSEYAFDEEDMKAMVTFYSIVLGELEL